METIQAQQASPMPAQLQKEHQWLQKLVGEWVYETEVMMGSDQNGTKLTKSISRKTGLAQDLTGFHH